MSKFMLMIFGFLVLVFGFSTSAEAKESEEIPENWIRVRCTAYYTADNEMEGGFFDKLGRLLNPKEHVLAMDKSRAYGERFRLHGTGTWRDDYVWTNKDCGGRIYKQDNGVERVDILVESESEANEFGVRYCWMEEVYE